MNGEKLFRMVTELAASPDRLLRMSEAARRFARPGAANRAVDILRKWPRLQIGIDRNPEHRNNRHKKCFFDPSAYTSRESAALA